MSNEQPKKIIVDDDWKTRVQAEKESLSAKPQDEPARAAANQTDSENDDDVELPPASFESLVSMLVTQTLAALRQLPMQGEERPVVMLNYAKHYIDLLGMLEEKTKGNLSASEANMLTNLLHELRMVFVSVKAHPPA